jgi:hypothetical protein
MRIIWKLSAFVLLGVVMQCGIVRYADDVDEAMFILRVGIARAQGAEIDDHELVIAASRLHRRRCERHNAGFLEYWDHRDAALASANDV